MHEIFLIQLIQRREQPAVIPGPPLIFIGQQRAAKQHHQHERRDHDRHMHIKDQQEELQADQEQQIDQDADEMIERVCAQLHTSRYPCPRRVSITSTRPISSSLRRSRVMFTVSVLSSMNLLVSHR